MPHVTAVVVPKRPIEFSTGVQCILRTASTFGYSILQNPSDTIESFRFWMDRRPDWEVDYHRCSVVEWADCPVEHFKRCTFNVRDPHAARTDPSWSLRWDASLWLDAPDLITRVVVNHPIFWDHYVNYHSEVESYSRQHLEFQVKAARAYYLNRCLLRAFNARGLYAWPDWTHRLDDSLFIFRPGRRSLVIPPFEDYCRQVGYACVDDLDNPVERVPDYVPTGPLWDEIRTLPLN